MSRIRGLVVTSMLVISVAVTGGACSSSDTAQSDVIRLWIEPELVECEGVAPMECMQVSRTQGGDLELFYDQIEGFTHEQGTSYVIDVRVTKVDDPPADASSLQYSLVEIVETSP